MYVCNLTGEYKSKSVVNDDEIFMGSTQGKAKRREDILLGSDFKVKMYVVNKKKK